MKINMRLFNQDSNYQYHLKRKLIYKAVRNEISEVEKTILLELVRDQIQRYRNHCRKNEDQTKKEITQLACMKNKADPNWMKDYQKNKLELISYEIQILSKIYQVYLECLLEKNIEDILFLNNQFTTFFTYRKHIQSYVRVNYMRMIANEKEADHTSYYEAKRIATLNFNIQNYQVHQNQDSDNTVTKGKQLVYREISAISFR